jgi:hypothetical protein
MISTPKLALAVEMFVEGEMERYDGARDGKEPSEGRRRGFYEEIWQLELRRWARTPIIHQIKI